jgi:hypothetical protein
MWTNNMWSSSAITVCTNKESEGMTADRLCSVATCKDYICKRYLNISCLGCSPQNLKSVILHMQRKFYPLVKYNYVQKYLYVHICLFTLFLYNYPSTYPPIYATTYLPTYLPPLPTYTCIHPPINLTTLLSTH